MVDRLAHAAAVVGADRIDGEGTAELALDRDDRPVELGERGEQAAIVLARRRHQHRVDPPAVQVADIRRIGLGVVVRAHDEERIAGRPEHELGAGDDLRRERIGQVGGDEADQVGRAATKALGDSSSAGSRVRPPRSSTRMRSAGITSPRPEKTFDTVEIATPARCATSRIPIRRGGGPLSDSPRKGVLYPVSAAHESTPVDSAPAHSMPSIAKRFAKRFLGRSQTISLTRKAGREDMEMDARNWLDDHARHALLAVTAAAGDASPGPVLRRARPSRRGRRAASAARSCRPSGSSGPMTRRPASIVEAAGDASAPVRAEPPQAGEAADLRLRRGLGGDPVLGVDQQGHLQDRRRSRHQRSSTATRSSSRRRR